MKAYEYSEHHDDSEPIPLPSGNTPKNDISESEYHPMENASNSSRHPNVENMQQMNKDPIHKIWQLVTFFRRVFIYFVIVGLADYGKLDLPSWGRLVFKCLPVFTLSVFIFNQFNSLKKLFKNSFARLIFLGMTFSYVGDGLLVFQENHTLFFLGGLVSFAIAHVFYTFAFGWRPFQSRMMLRALIAAGLIYYYLYTEGLNERGVGLVAGVAVYCCVIMAMQWRAWARLSYRDIKGGRIYVISGALGSSFFALSDAILGINKFAFPVPGSDYTILATYFLGQMLIALSVIDSSTDRTQEDVERQFLIDEDGKGSTFLTKAIKWFIN